MERVSSSSSATPLWEYDVFLSFRGEDTPEIFADHLYTALKQKGINTFRDDKRIVRGESISPELLKAIEVSRFALIVLSRNYAYSSWCLDELAKIVECMREGGMAVWPIFYDVDPSDVQNQTGPFAKAFAEHEERFNQNMEKVQAWRSALSEVANLSGWHVGDRHESKIITEIMEKIFQKLCDTFPRVTKGLVGIHFQVDHLLSLLCLRLNDVRVIGIWGMGGIGKTTLAGAVYDRISSQFEGCSFIENVKDFSKESGLIAAQHHLLVDILEEEEILIFNVDSGVNLIKNRLRSKKILLVLDDVNHLDQLKYLANEPDWFGSGSRIIITTRDQHLLNAYGVDEIYKCKELNDEDSLKLLCLKVFNKEEPKQGYKQVSLKIVDCANGLPLALDVLGSLLVGRGINHWMDALERLKQYPEANIFGSLKMSYDGLDNETEQSIFIYIACFLRGKNLGLVIDILESLDLYPTIGMDVLIKRSLITISNDMVQMPGLLQDMAWEILRKQSPTELGNRRGLRLPKDVFDVLENNKGTNALEIVYQDLSDGEVGNCTCSPEVFSKMTKLRFLKISNVLFPRGLEFLSNELRILEWRGYPLKSLPSSFKSNEIRELNMHDGKIERLWERAMHFPNLRSIDLSGSEYLTQTPNVSGTPSLVKLDLHGCTNLVEGHPSIFVHERLNYLNLKGCSSLENLPSKIEMKSLKTLDLSNCSKVKRIPEFGENMKCLKELHLNGTAIKKIPPSIKHLTDLDFSRCSELEKPLEKLGETVCFENLDTSKTAIHGMQSMRNITETSMWPAERLGDSNKLDEKLETPERKLEQLSSRQMDINTEVANAELQGKKRRREVENWSINVERIGKKVQSIEQAEQESGVLSRVLKLGNQGEKLIVEVAELIDEGRFSQGLTLDVMETRGVTKGLVGIYNLVEELNCLLCVGSDDVRVIGICGMGGIGKTTLAKVVCDIFSSDFEGCSFLKNVKDFSKESDFVQLQQQLLYEILKEENIHVHIRNVDDGVKLIKNMLCGKKILLVLDDVNHLDQLKYLAKERDWFGFGSRIIITTRDQHLLNAYRVDGIHKCKKLNAHDSLKLFCLKAFKKEQPEEGYEGISLKIVDYADGLPLVLDVLGSFLVDRGINHWKDAVKRLKQYPEANIFRSLKMSYDGLNNEIEKRIFIYIACFLSGRNLGLIIDILESLDFYPKIGMDVLIERSLITISNDIVHTHVLLQDMAWEILRRQSPAELGNRRGLRLPKDVFDVLENNKGTNALEIINQDSSIGEVKNCSPEAFSKMGKLKFLRISNVLFPQGLEFLSNELRILEWHGYPLKSLPSSFHSNEICELDMSYSKIEKLWEGTMLFPNLRSIGLSASENLTQTPDVSGTPSLETLDLHNCINLVEWHQSILVHKRLNYLNLAGCISLENLPSKIEMESLKTLILSECSKVKRLPEFGENMKCLKELLLNGTAIEEIPPSIKHLTDIYSFMESTQCLSSSSSSSSTTPRRTYDVFLSFRCADTRVGFTDHLQDALKWNDIRTFKDDREIEIGDSIPFELMKAIEESTSAIIVFSENYADSTLCLDELVKIVECMHNDKMKLTVLPIFYYVKPSVVRDQKDAFGEAIAKHEKRFSKNMEKDLTQKKNMEKVERWKTALTEVATISGEEVPARYERKVIKNIIKKICQLLSKCPRVTKGLVGIKSQMEKLKLNLDLKSNDVRVTGIWGMGGIGKTTLAEAVYDTFSVEFEGCSFIEKVKERRLIEVQQELISDICNGKNIPVRNIRDGVQRIKISLHSKKFLLVLDDVTDNNQLKNLVEWNWFGPNSRIIITTRDQHLLKILKVTDIYECEKLNDSDALELFCLKAFKKEQPKQGYENLSKKFVRYASGLPLALDCLGSLLFGRPIDLWENALEGLKKHLEETIFQNLKRSFDELNYVEEKEIFIYIACFLNGRNKDLVADILESLMYFPIIGMAVLKERALITISDNIVWVDDLLEQMGWEILHKQSYKDRIGLKFREDIVASLTNNMGPMAIKIINQESPTTIAANCTCNPKAFSQMKKLEFLNIRDVHFPYGIEYLSNELRILEWNGYPSKSLPSNFTPSKIYELRMCSSNIEKLWEGAMEFNNLGFIDLRGSTNLTQTPDLSLTPNLKHLYLSNCTNLVEVHESIFVHESLNCLNLAGCTSLKLERVQNEIKMKSLKTLDLSGCSSVERIPEFGEDMKSLQKLCLDCTAIKKLPSSIEHLTCLASLYARNCTNLERIPYNICDLRSLRDVKFSKWSKLEKLPENLAKIVCWENLEPVTSTQAASVAAATSDELAAISSDFGK